MKPDTTETTPGRGPSSLTALCLPRDDERATRHLAWAVSVCAMCLAVGIFGLNPPRIAVREVARPTDIVPVIFTQPAEAQPPPPQPRPDDHTPSANPLAESPVVATVVAVDSPAIAFAVPVKGPAILAPARFAEPPRTTASQPAAPNLSRFNPGAGDRSTPQPDYPRLALQRGYEGSVTVNFTVEPSGEVGKVELARSSGVAILDEAALGVIRERWRFAPGPTRHHFVEIIFQLKK